jgi:Flp pilus assembly protein TadD
MDQPGQAIEALRRALALDPSNGFAWDDFSTALASVGNHVEAARAASMGRKLG